jgi:hypothetical protein
MSLFNFFKKQEEDLEFIDVTEQNVVYPHYPIKLAKDVPTSMKEKQIAKLGKYEFIVCPGMHDYSRLGYIVPAWSNLVFKANKAGVIAAAGATGQEAIKRATPIGQPRLMETNIVEGAIQLYDNIPLQVFNFPSAWRIFSTKNISALVLPAFYHSDFLENLHIFPGVVDYNQFSTINLICAVKRKCEFTIKAGEPLLHVIPFITNQDIVASYGPGSRETEDSTKVVKWYHEKNFYRKYYMIKKKFKLFKKVPP